MHAPVHITPRAAGSGRLFPEQLRWRRAAATALLLPLGLLVAACGQSDPVGTRPGLGTGISPGGGTGSGTPSPTPTQTVAPCVPGATQATLPAVLTVTSGGNRAEVQTRAFQLRFIDSQGRTVLAEVPNTGQGPMPQAGSPTEILGGSTQPNPTLYAPMAFLVGSQQTTQSPGSIYGGNELGGASAGVLYSAQAVTGVQYCGAAKDASGGAVLTVATSDPTGRLLKVTVTPGAQNTIRVAAVTVAAPGQPEAEPVAVLADSFATATDEAFHGFGGRHNALDERGLSFYDWIEQENFDAGPAEAGAEASSNTQGYLFPNGPTAAYHVQSLFASSRPYAFLLNRYELARFRLASDMASAWQVGVAANAIDYSVAFGDAPTALAALTAITGRQRLPPAWSLHPIIDRLVPPFNSPTAAQYEALVRQDIADFDKYHPPLAGYRLEGWARLTDDTLRELIGELASRGIHALLYYKAFVASDSNDLDRAGTFTDAVTNDYLANTSAGTPYLAPSFGTGVAGVIDFTKPSAVAWWQGRLQAGLDLGADGFMEDFGEQVQGPMVFADGSTGSQTHNRYPGLYHHATRQLVQAYEAAHPGREIFFFTRAGYSGTADEPSSIAWDSANFLGDETTDFTRSSGLASQITDLLNRGLGGAYGGTTDIGGYEDIISGTTTKELLVRWCELAALTPFYRLHNSANAGTQMPWNFDQQTVDLYNAYAGLHIRALPLIQALWRQALAGGPPPLRPLWMQYPGDATASAQDQEFMLGPDVLVAPVVTAAATGRTVYLPAGCWQRRGVDGGSVGDPLAGGASVTATAALGELPYYFHCGTQPF